MRRLCLPYHCLAGLFALLPIIAPAEQLELRNATTVARFGPSGLISIKDSVTNAGINLAADKWSLTLDRVTLRSTNATPRIRRVGTSGLTYYYDLSGYQIEATYRLRPGWRFVSKQLTVLRAPHPMFAVQQVLPLDITLRDQISSVFVPSTYAPQLGQTIEQSRKTLPGKDFGAFLRFAESNGAMLVVQNPYLEVGHDGNSATVAYSPDMQWNQSWGDFTSDTACIGPYHLSGQRMPREMALEWHLPPATPRADGMDRAEIAAFRDCVHAFLINPAPLPTSVEVGWTLNDYQIDVGTPEGKAEYKRIIDSASVLGIHTLLYAPGNSKLAERTQSADAWSWEYVLWLNLGQKIRKGEWDAAKDSLPDDLTEMLSYAKSKRVGLLAYVYPSVPYAKSASWLIKRAGEEGLTYATLASREFQDYLIRNLIEFQRRTGIAGYSFDYTWLDLPGSSSYTQWFGWRRVMQELRRANPALVIDGRQSYQQYGPWSWLAGSYPHPTGNDEQPESFKPYPDLHFDRVSADRTRFVNYWYRNYQFAPAEVIPGYATHQTERSINLPADGTAVSQRYEEKTIYTRYLPRDWDYLGYRYSFLSSIATGGWNNVVNMIPARDAEEWQHFSESDKAWIRNWLNWTTEHKEYIRNTRTILDQPEFGHVDGTEMMLGDRGYFFLFNPNYKQLPATLALDSSVDLSKGGNFLLREVYPNAGRMIGKPGAGVWSSGDQVHLSLDGTSATVLELIPSRSFAPPVVFGAAAKGGAAQAGPRAVITGNRLAVEHVAGEPGTSHQVGVLLPASSRVLSMTVNGHAVHATQTGRYVSAEVQFAGMRFSQAHEIVVAPATGGTISGRFAVPQRILDQLSARKLAWPIPWTREDYKTTWLAPERLLLFVQFADGKDTINLSGTIDGEPLSLKAAYSSTRVHPESFVGFYADLSSISPDKQHSLLLKISGDDRARLQGVFFDNVEPQFTEEMVP